MRYWFGECILDMERYVLCRAGQDIQLRPKAFELLRYLLTHPNRVILKEELCAQVWPQQFISDETLASTIRAVRQAIGDSRREQRLIQTVYGYGYRCMAAVEEQAVPRLEPTPRPAVVTAAGADGLPPLDASSEGSPPQAGSPLVLAPGSPALERKWVTVLCAALAATPAGSAPPDPDASYRQLRDLYTCVRVVIQRYGGTMQPVVGDAVLAVFGAPVAQEDHAQRAVLAALALHRVGVQLISREVPVPVRVGVHTGLAVVGGNADDPITAGMVVGDTVSLALTLQGQAAPETILCSAVTARLVQGVVRCAAAPPVSVAGQTTALPVYTVLGPRRHRPVGVRQRRVRTPFLGRQRELATLERLLAQTQEGRGQVVGLVGEPGIGKSRLVYSNSRP